MDKNTKLTQFPQAVTIAGHDSDGSAGMPADLHAFYNNQVYGHGILTAAVAGNSYGIFAAQEMPADFITKQFETLAEDFDIKAAKTGMLGSVAVIKAVHAAWQKVDFGPLVVDPVIITKHGAMLLEEDAYQAFKDLIIPLADVITPNHYEAQALTAMDLTTREDYVKAGHLLHAMGAKNVVIKGSHTGDLPTVTDYVLLEDGSEHWLEKPYVETTRVNGTGDVFSATIAAGLAKGDALVDAIKVAKDAVYKAIATPVTVGHKFGPVNCWAAKGEA